MPTEVINRIPLYWQLTGESGDPLVLVHGSWGDADGWAPIVPALSGALRVVTYDRRGHSRSGGADGQGSVRDDVADLAALVEHLGLGAAHLLGNSFGGSIVLRLAAERPELVRTLIAHEPPLLGLLPDRAGSLALADARARIAAVVGLIESGRMEDAARLFMETVAFGPGAWGQIPPEIRARCVQNAPTFLDEERDPESRTMPVESLARIARPALLTDGDRSEPFFGMILDALARAVPGATRQRLAGTGHVPHLTHPTQYVAAIQAFLAKRG